MNCFSRENIIDLFVSLFPNKRILDKLSQDENGVLLFNGKKVCSCTDDTDTEPDTPSEPSISFVGYVINTNDYYSPKTITEIINISTFDINSDFVNYDTSVNNHYSSKIINELENISTNATFTFTDDIVEVKI